MYYEVREAVEIHCIHFPLNNRKLMNKVKVTIVNFFSLVKFGRNEKKTIVHIL